MRVPHVPREKREENWPCGRQTFEMKGSWSPLMVTLPQTQIIC
jgi:hypothetical protein